MGGTEDQKRNRDKQGIGWRRGDLQPGGAFSGKAGVDQRGKTLQTVPSPETSTGRVTGGGKGRSGNPVGESRSLTESGLRRSRDWGGCQEGEKGWRRNGVFDAGSSARLGAGAPSLPGPENTWLTQILSRQMAGRECALR